MFAVAVYTLECSRIRTEDVGQQADGAGGGQVGISGVIK
jgi:hypothetical protein